MMDETVLGDADAESARQDRRRQIVIFKHPDLVSFIEPANLLEEVAQMVGVGLVGASEALEGSAEKGGGLAILIILRSFHG